MDVVPPSLEIRIHLVNGRVAEFVQTNPAAVRQILEGMQPAKVFSQSHLIIAGKYSLTAYSSRTITAVELIMDGYPDWPTPPPVEELRLTSEEEFWKHFEAEKDQKFIREQERKVGKPITGYLELELVSGERFFVEIQSRVLPKLDQRHIISQMFSAPVLWARRPEGGVTLVNPDNIVRFTFNPGPPHAPKNAWPAHHKVQT